MMPDHWGYVAAAYAIGAAVLGAYWRHLVHRERALAAARGPRRSRASVPSPSRAQPAGPKVQS
jgi:hypothetical protein